jgi:hypothetical protein
MCFCFCRFQLLYFNCWYLEGVCLIYSESDELLTDKLLADELMPFWYLYPNDTKFGIVRWKP